MSCCDDFQGQIIGRSMLNRLALPTQALAGIGQ